MNPLVDVFGSFFPVWLFCIAGGVAVTLVVRWLLVFVGIDSVLWPKVLVYPGMATLFACAIWLVFLHD